MSIEFEHPWFLLLLIPALAAAAIPFFLARKKKKTAKRHLISFVLRAVSILLAVLIISGFTARRSSDREAIMVVADLSDSTRNVTDELRRAVKTAAGYANAKTDVGLLTFGYNSFYEIPLGAELSFSSFETDPDGNYTDIYSALIKAAAMMPGDRAKRIVLLTDGKENIGRVQDAASVLIQRDIRLDAIVYETGITENEIQITDISTPDTVYKGENFNITVIVESSCECQAELTLYSDNAIAVRQTVNLTTGTNRFVFKDTAETSGITTYSAEISAENDSLGKNNRVYSFIKVFGSPKLLIVDGTGNEAHELVTIIGESAEISTVAPAQVPTDITELRKYDSVILMNVSQKSLPENWDSLVDVYVRQLGRGLFTTGGNKSYALGGWAGSKLEEILPVDMEAKDKVALCDMALMLLVDNSGSMGGGPGSPLELAKQGAINAAGTIKDIDEVGVIAFSDNAVWVSHLTSGAKKAEVQSRISTIPGGGGTMIFSAIQSAYAELKESDKSMKNIILLTDGDPADGDQVMSSGILQQMAADGVTVTSIAVGSFIDEQTLRMISEPTGGTVTVCHNVNDLPEVIFTETVKILENSYINNVTFTPAVEDYTQVLSGIDGLPELDGFILTTPKDLAYTVLAYEDGSPVLASWQYGLGKTASLTTDLNGKWSSKLLASENGRALLMNVISYVLPADEDSSTGTLTLSRSGDKGIITAVSPDKDASHKTTALVISPTGAEEEIELVQSGIGEYTGEFFLGEEGGYVAIVTQKDEEGNNLMYKESALAVKYSDEYDMFIVDTGAVAAACVKTGGKGDWKDVASILGEKLSAARESLQFTTPFLIIIIILTMADIALRRLNLSFDFLRSLREKKAEKAPAAPAEAEVTPKKPKNRPEKKKNEPKEKKNAPPPVYVPDGAVLPEKEKKKKKEEAPQVPEKKEGPSTVSSILQQKNNRNRRM